MYMLWHHEDTRFKTDFELLVQNSWLLGSHANRVQATTVAVITTSFPKVMNSYSRTAVNSTSARLKNMDQNRGNQIFFKLAVSVRYDFKFMGIAVLD